MKKGILVFLLCLSLIVSGLSFFKYQELDKEVEEKKQKLENKTKEKNTYEEEIEKLELQKKELEETKKEEIKVYEKWKEKVGKIESLL